MITPTGKPPGSIGEALGPMLRKAIRPVALATTDERAFAARVTALCERIEHVGEGRRGQPFCGYVSGEIR